MYGLYPGTKSEDLDVSDVKIMSVIPYFRNVFCIKLVQLQELIVQIEKTLLLW